MGLFKKKAKFVSIVLDDEELIKEGNEIVNRKASNYNMIRDLEIIYRETSNMNSEWFNKIRIKYNISDKYYDKLFYEKKTSTVSIKE